jgi:hypothetical protein
MTDRHDHRAGTPEHELAVDGTKSVYTITATNTGPLIATNVRVVAMHRQRPVPIRR